MQTPTDAGTWSGGPTFSRTNIRYSADCEYVACNSHTDGRCLLPAMKMGNVSRECSSKICLESPNTLLLHVDIC